MKFLEVNNLDIEYQTRKETIYASKNVSFNLQRGEIIGIVGESGSGKSTVANAIINLIDKPGIITNGSIRLDGRELHNDTDVIKSIRGKKIGFIFQDPQTSLNPLFKIRDQLIETIQTHSDLNYKEAESKSINLLREVGIENPEKRINDYPHQFSGGMRQRVVIALAISCEPDLIIADEPTTALDVSIQYKILQLLKKLTVERNLGIIIITLLLFLILIDGEKINGAQRWFYIGGLSFQPSEIGKPLYVVFNAWLLSLWIEKTKFPGWMWSIASIILISSLLLLQPDLGMTIVMMFTWGFQLFITGIPLILILCLIIAFPIFMIFSYQHFNHVKIRIDNFLEGKTYQVSKSLQSFESGGFWGKGPGEGFYKKSLPDAHSDFVFAVAAEEYGALICSVIIIIYGLIIIRSFYYTINNNNLFFILAIGGLAFQFGSQSLIHMASNTDLIPTKGMTLPFLSYGGFLKVCRTDSTHLNQANAGVGVASTSVLKIKSYDDYNASYTDSVCYYCTKKTHG